MFAIGLGLRLFSPLMPDVLSGRAWPPVSDCVRSTPVDAAGHTGTLCGLAYPYQRYLGRPDEPRQGQVFDEAFFAVFAHDDLRGIPYYDVQPPLGKLLIAAGEYLHGWWRATFQGAGGSYADLGYDTFGWRLVTCLFGSLCVPLMGVLGWQLWPDRLFAFTAAALTCFDGLFFVQSRIGVIEIFPVFFIALAYTLFLVHLRSRDERGAIITLLLTGLALGLGVAAKWIAVGALGSIVLLLALRPVWRRMGIRDGAPPGAGLPGGARAGPYAAAALVAFAVVPAAVYLASWTPFFLRGQFHGLGDLAAYERQVLVFHVTMRGSNPFASPWYTWPLLTRPMQYYSESVGLGADAASGRPLIATIFNIGNPVIWWASIPAVLSLPVVLLRRRSLAAVVILAGFCTQYLPWALVAREEFLYHMFGGLVFMVLALAFVLVRVQRAGPVRVRAGGARLVLPTAWVVPCFLALTVGAFAYLYPLWTALPVARP